MGGTPHYVYRDGQRLTLWMLYVIALLDVDLFRAFGVHVLVTSAIRTYEEQKRIFLERYVTAGNIRGRTVYDTRVWNGVRWYRISAAGTVAVPGFSNHEIQGTKAAVDIRDTGSDAGITARNSTRGRWIRDWCRRTGLLIASGDGFGEGWHFDVPGIFRTPPAMPAGTEIDTSKEDDMTPEQARTLQITAERTEAVYAALFGPANLGVDKTTWKKPFGETHGEAYYGMFDVLIALQGTLASSAGQLAAVKAAVSQLSAGSGVALDMKAIEDAAERGAKDALKGLTLTSKS